MVTRYGQADIPREVSGRGRPVVGQAAADFPRDVCLTVSRNHAVFLLYPRKTGGYNSPSMGLLPDTQNYGCACAGNAGNVFPVTAGKRSRHASRHVRHARAVKHAGIANKRFALKSAAGENVPGIPGACATCNFTYLVRGPYLSLSPMESRCVRSNYIYIKQRVWLHIHVLILFKTL